MNQFKFNPKYPSKSAVLKEIGLSAIGIVICSYYESVIAYHRQSEWNALANSYDSLPTNKDKMLNIIFNVASLKTAGMLIWIDAHFYFYHRFFHIIPPLYRHVHYLHHESRNVDPFSGLSFHPIESMIYFSSLLMFISKWMNDIPYWLFLLFKYGVMIAPLKGHSGMGTTSKADMPIEYLLDSFDHYIHHTLYNYNYGSGLLPIWDNVLGTKYNATQKEHFCKHRT